MLKVHVPIAERSYDIYIHGSFANLAEYALAPYKSYKIMVVADSNVDKIFSAECFKEIEKVGAVPFKHVFPAGESSKNIETVNEIYKACLKNKFERGDAIIALGGGVAGDMAGFAAATYMRGLNFIQVPTSVLAQCDSSIGGKVGVDFEGVKNIIGSFYQPKCVYINTGALKTLPEREYFSGFGEIVKHAIIKDEILFEYLENNIEALCERNTEVLSTVIERNCKIKAEIVSIDERETGLREILNFGHTIGHAIESESDFSMLHGECVSIGMVAISNMAVRMGLLSLSDFNRIIKLLQKLKLPVIHKGLDSEDIYSLMQLDKKVKKGRINYIVPVKIGEVRITSNIDENTIKEALQDIL
ncbi:MAG: 3-dehydroquinate synthase [Deltaproteobacteria bacterium]